MARMVRVPASVRRYFTNEELSGWMPGVQYTPRPRKERSTRRRRIAEAMLDRELDFSADAPPATRVEVGVSAVR